MYKIKKILVVVSIVILGMCVAPAAFAACTTDQIDVAGDGSICETTKFTVTTTSLAANTEFKFYMSASGTFYVDCGDGVLSGAGALVVTVTRTDTTEELYKCTYTTAGVKTIRFGGRATGYNTEMNPQQTARMYAAIRFGGTPAATPSFVAAISGSLGAIFPTLGTGYAKRPTFYYTFSSTQITSIPETLFNGVTGSTNSMFRYTFRNCQNVTSIPENLFTGITGDAYKTFDGTFAWCTSLTSIPENLFASVTILAGDIFMQTFAWCTSLTSIPENLFTGTIGTGGYVFYETFRECTSLTSIPEKLFASVKGARVYAFYRTFVYCTSLSGYVPPNLFAGLIENGSPYESAMMYNIFGSTNLATTCPTGTVQFITGYEDYWSGHVACVDVCTGDGTTIRTSNGLIFPLYGEKVTTPSLNVRFANGTMCYTPLVTGVGGTGTMNFTVADGEAYHANSIAN